MHRRTCPAYAMLDSMAKLDLKKKREGAARSYRSRPIADMLPKIGREAFRKFGFVQSSIVSRWREIVGEKYAGVSCPESIRFPPGRKSGGVLTLVVESAHAPMMQHVAPVIIERINRFFGYNAVERVSFRQGLVKIARQSRDRALNAMAMPLPRELGDSLKEVADPELKAVLESLARSLTEEDGRKHEITTIPIVGKLAR